MSRSEDRTPEEGSEAALGAVEAAVGRAVARIRELEAKVRAAEDRRQEVEELLERMAGGDESPVRMQERLDRLRTENEDLHRRLDAGREGVERMLAKIRFLEEQR